MLKDELASMLLLEYESVLAAPSAESLMNAYRGRDELMSDEDAAKGAIRDEWPRWYKTIETKWEEKKSVKTAWIMKNPALITLQSLARPGSALIRIFPKLMMTQAQITAFEKEHAKEEKTFASPSKLPEELDWAGAI